MPKQPVDGLSASNLGQLVHAYCKARPTYDIAAPDDDTGLVTVYLKQDSSRLRNDLLAQFGDRVRFEVVGPDGGWFAYVPPG